MTRAIFWSEEAKNRPSAGFFLNFNQIAESCLFLTLNVTEIYPNHI